MKFKVLVIVFLLGIFSEESFGTCSSPVGTAGESRWDSTGQDLIYCNGTEWKSLKYGGMSVVSMTFAPTVNTINTTKSIAISGNYAYLVSSSPAAFNVLDITSINNPQIVTSVADSNLSANSDMVISGSYAFVAVGTKLIIYNISDPLNPTLTATLNDSANITTAGRITVSGDFIYITTTQVSPSLVIIDVTTKSSPVYRGKVALSGIGDVAVSGNYAYVARNGSMSVIDVSSSTAPAIVSTLTNTLFAGGKGIEVSGNFAYLLSSPGLYAGQISVIDISNKLAPEYISGVGATTTDYMEDLADIELQGSYITVVQANGRNSTNYMSTFDVSDPLKLKLMSVVAVEQLDKCNRLVVVNDKTACINATAAASPNTHFFDSAMKPILPYESTSTIFNPDTSFISNVDVNGNLAVLTDGALNMWVVDVSTPATPVPRGAFSIPQEINRANMLASLYFDGTYAFVTSTNASRLYVIDVGTNPDKPKLVSTFTNTNLAQADGIKVVGSYAFIAAYKGLTILDVANPLNPVFISHLDSAGATAKGVAVSGNYAYITGSNTFSIFDITNKSSPVLLGSITDSTNLSQIFDVEVSGNYAFVAVSGRMTIIDISIPSSPSVAATLVNSLYSTSPYSMEKIGNYVVSNGTASKAVVTDISNPLAPSFVNNTMSCMYWIKVYGTSFYCGTNSGILHSYDLTTPATPTLIKSFSYPGIFSGSTGLTTSGNFAYVTASTRNQFHVVSFSNPSDPEIVNTITHATQLAAPKNVAVSGNYAYVVGPSYVTIIDISTPASAAIVGTLSDATNLAGPRAIAISGNYAYVVTNGGITVINVTTKASPTFVTSLASASMTDCRQIEIHNGYAYVPCYTSDSLGIISLSSPAAPTLEGIAQDATYLNGAQSVVIVDSYAYVSRISGLGVIDISSPSTPVVQPMSPTTFTTSSIATKGRYIFAGSWEGNLISLKNPSTPQHLNARIAYAIGAFQRMSISGNYLIVVGNNKAGLQIWDISNRPLAVEEEAFLNNSNLLGGATDVKVVGNYAYVLAEIAQRVTVVDISDPDVPVILGSVHSYLLKGARNLEVEGNYAYATGFSSNYFMPIIDVSDPNSIFVAASYSSFSYFQQSQNLKKSGNYIFNSSGAGKFSAVNLTSPLAPAAAGTLTISSPRGFDISGNYAFVCSSSTNSLVVVNISNPASMTISNTLTDANLANCNAVAISGNHVFVHSGNPSKKLSVIDISTPTSPSFAGVLEDNSLLNGGKISVVGDIVYVPTTSDGLVMIDTSNKSNPQIMDTLPYNTSSTSSLKSIVANGTLAFGVRSTESAFGVYRAEPTISLGSCSVSGEISFDLTQNVFGICDGTTKYSMAQIPGAGGTGCSSPNASKGVFQYFTGDSRYKFCDGTSWLNAGK